jgi:UDP-N-acetyl-D-glucosamine dehydrogenase
MPHHVVDKIADVLSRDGKPINGSRILLMGVAYKPDVADVRESPALDVLALLLKKGAIVSYHDPFVPSINIERVSGGSAMKSVPYTRELVATADCVVVLTDHSAFDYGELVAAARLIVDTRNAVKVAASKVAKLGVPSSFEMDRPTR